MENELKLSLIELDFKITELMNQLHNLRSDHELLKSVVKEFLTEQLNVMSKLGISAKK